jgi:hypothetical protein
MHRAGAHRPGAGNSSSLLAQWNRLPIALRILVLVLAAWVAVGIVFLLSAHSSHNGRVSDTMTADWQQQQQQQQTSSSGKVVNVQLKLGYKLGASEDLDWTRGRPPLPHGHLPEP